MRSPDQDPEEIVWAAAKVGFDALAGELDGGFPAWKNSATAATGSLIEAGRLVSGTEARLVPLVTGTISLGNAVEPESAHD